MKRNAAHDSEENFECHIENAADLISGKFEDFPDRRGGELILRRALSLIFDCSDL